MLPIILSVAISALVTIALLLLTRQRLARQFDDIQRRLGQLERTVSELKLARERSTVPAQLQRVHRGLVRLQETMASRFGPLLATAEEIRRRNRGNRRFPTEIQMRGLEDWSKALGLGQSRGEIESLSRAVARIEQPDSFPMPMVDLLAGIMAIFHRGFQPAVVACAPPNGEKMEAIFRQLPAPWSELVKFERPPRGNVDIVFSDASGSVNEDIHFLKIDGLLIRHGSPESTDDSAGPEGFDLIAQEWRTRVYRKIAGANNLNP